MNNEDIKICTREFFTHPEWDRVLNIIRYYADIETSDKIEEKDFNKDPEQFYLDTKVKFLVAKTLKKFIDDTLTIKKIKETVPKTTRKYK